MKKNSLANIFSATNPLKILSFLSDNPGKEFLGSEIKKATSMSRAGVYITLRDLIELNLVHKNQKGKILMYSVVFTNPIIKQFKVLKNIVNLEKAVQKLKNISRKIILFGSSSRGEDYSDSDLDVFILAKDTEAAKAILSTIKNGRKIQAVIKTPAEFSGFQETEKVFHSEIERGITLWEEHE
ncbi:MAG: nucleotidyltransferase domain-containing protein [Elusimicrobia bacterium]|nr:nucleotidyltransferase domain-containing protein [Elusimicrobiota bacterium]